MLTYSVIIGGIVARLFLVLSGCAWIMVSSPAKDTLALCERLPS